MMRMKITNPIRLLKFAKLWHPFLFFLCMSTIPAMARTIPIKGVVPSAEDESPLPGVTVGEKRKTKWDNYPD